MIRREQLDGKKVRRYRHYRREIRHNDFELASCRCMKRLKGGRVGESWYQ